MEVATVDYWMAMIARMAEKVMRVRKVRIYNFQ